MAASDDGLTVPLVNCACGFDPHSVTPTWGEAWHRAHKEHHLARFPDVDQGTRDNLDAFIRRAGGEPTQRQIANATLDAVLSMRYTKDMTTTERLLEELLWNLAANQTPEEAKALRDRLLAEAEATLARAAQ